jgi:putative phosphoesterase
VRVGLISDTHIPRDVKILPPHVKEAFREVALILHAGDIYARSVLDELENIAPVLAARGNGDYGLPQDSRVKRSHTLDLAGISVGICHGLDHPRSPEYWDRAMKREFGRRVDVVVVGDTHVAMVERLDGFCLVNPGSPTLPNNRYELGTVGLLEVAENRVEARIVQLDEFPLPFRRELFYY